MQYQHMQRPLRTSGTRLLWQGLPGEKVRLENVQVLAELFRLVPLLDQIKHVRDHLLIQRRR